MCFSASASFIASGGLAVLGGASLKIATKQQRIIAAIPLLFSVHQAFEGFQWLAADSGRVNIVSAYGFVIFALLVWPAYIPITVFLFDAKKRPVLIWPMRIGIALTLYFTILLLSEPIGVHVLDRGIYYQVNRLFGAFTGTLYFLAVCGSLLLSSHRAFRFFGVVTFASVMITVMFFIEAFASVWCFFAAILSALIYFYIRKQQKSSR